MPATLQQLLFAKAGQRNLLDEIAGFAGMAKNRFDRAETVALNRVVAQEALGQSVKLGRGQFSRQAVLRGSHGFKTTDAQFLCAAFKFSCGDVGYARAQGNLDDMIMRIRGWLGCSCWRLGVAVPGDTGRFRDRVDQQERAQFIDLV